MMPPPWFGPPFGFSRDSWGQRGRCWLVWDTSLLETHSVPCPDLWDSVSPGTHPPEIRRFQRASPPPTLCPCSLSFLSSPAFPPHRGVTKETSGRNVTLLFVPYSITRPWGQCGDLLRAWAPVTVGSQPSPAVHSPRPRLRAGGTWNVSSASREGRYIEVSPN
jgi:hypothetical protein